MASNTEQDNRRASITMYDPARDKYTVSDEDPVARDGEGQEHQLENAPDSGPEPRATVGSEVARDTTTASTLHSASTATIGHGSKLNEALFSPTTSLGETSPKHNSSGPTKRRASPPSIHLLTMEAQVAESGEKKPHSMESPGNEHSKPLPTESHGNSSPKAANTTNDALPKHVPTKKSTSPDMRQKESSPVNEKKRKLPESETQPEKSKPTPGQPLSKRKRQEERLQKNRRRGKTPPSAYSRRDRSPPRPAPARRSRSRSPDSRQRDYRYRKSRSPSPIRRSPSPDAPVRQRKRPGGGARVSAANIEAVRRRQQEREKQLEEEAQKSLLTRGVHDVVRQHYNAVPERGREWRKTDSKIKGLRSLNNWVKSTIIQKFSPDEEFLARSKDWADGIPGPGEDKRLLVIDLGCGKGGDLGKWQQAPQPVDLYVGLDPAEISIEQARERYIVMRNQRGRNRRGNMFHAEFYPKDCFGEWLGDVPIVQQVGIDGSVGPGGSLAAQRWGGGGFDVVVCMFTMHYAFESEQKARQMLHNVAGLLKKGGRFIGVGPNSDVLSAKVVEFHEKKKAAEAAAASKKEDEGEKEDGEVEDVMEVPEWGNSIYRVRFHGDTPEDGVFRPAFGWKYSYFMEEAVEEIPEYVVPWEAFRALTMDYNLELQYRKPFLDIWREEQNDPILGPLSERMGVRERGGGPLLVSDEEMEAAGFYHAFCFYKV